MFVDQLSARDDFSQVIITPGSTCEKEMDETEEAVTDDETTTDPTIGVSRLHAGEITTWTCTPLLHKMRARSVKRAARNGT